MTTGASSAITGMGDEVADSGSPSVDTAGEHTDRRAVVTNAAGSDTRAAVGDSSAAVGDAGVSEPAGGGSTDAAMRGAATGGAEAGEAGEDLVSRTLPYERPDVLGLPAQPAMALAATGADTSAARPAGWRGAGSPAGEGATSDGIAPTQVGDSQPRDVQPRNSQPRHVQPTDVQPRNVDPWAEDAGSPAEENVTRGQDDDATRTSSGAIPAQSGSPQTEMDAIQTKGGRRRGGSHRGAGATATGGRKRRRRRSLFGVAAAAMVILLGAIGLVTLTGGAEESERSAQAPAASPAPEGAKAPGAQPAVTEPPADGPVAPGVRWPSGANGNPPLDIRAWEAWTGRATNVAVVFTKRNDWNGIVYDNWPMSDYPPGLYNGQLSIAQPLFPRSGDERTCARGHYDAYWAAFGQTLTRNGRPDAIVRLGWEFNGNWFWWYPRDTTTWKTCFQRAVTQIRSTAPAVRIDFNVSAHRDRMPNGDDVWAAYPGDEFVNIVSSDAYDSYPPSHSAETFDQQCNIPSGACTVAAFARAHGKQFAVPEWGLVRVDGNGGGDNPLFIEKMHDLFERNRDILAYEAYFSTAEADNVRSSLINPPLNPMAAQRYLELFGAGAGIGTGTGVTGGP